MLYYGGIGYLPKLDGEPTVRLLRHAKQAGTATAPVTTVVHIMPPLSDISALVDPCLEYTDYVMSHLDAARKVAKLPVCMAWH